MLTKTRKWLIALVLSLAFVLVACTEKVPTLTVNENEKVLTLTAGDTKEINAVISSKDKKKEYKLAWESNDPFVATVNEEGVITASNEGETTITVTVKGTSVSVTIRVTVILPKPTKISIVKEIYDGDGSVVLVGAATMELGITTVPEKAISTVIWSSSDPKVATVDQNGKITGLIGGNVKIRAISTEDDTIRDEIELVVVENLDDFQVILNVMRFVQNNIPKYILDDLILPEYPNKHVTVEYYDRDKNRHSGGIYVYNHSEDYIDLINVVIKYKNIVKDDFSVLVNVAADPVNNDFEAIEYAKGVVEEFLKEYKEDKVYADLMFPTTVVYGEGDNQKTITVSWDSSDITKLTDNGIFIRPNDDSTITLEAYFVSGGISSVTRHQILVNGYTQAEKIEYMKEHVLPTLTEIEGRNINLPTRDSKFSTTIVWTSNKGDVLSSIGRMDPYLENITEVILTAKITYTSKSEGWSFVEELTFPITVKPAANDAQKVILDLVNVFDDGVLPVHFAYGVQDRQAGNKLSLPAKVGGDGPFADVAITWTASEADLFDGDWNLLKQYLRYHEVILTYSVTVGEATATGEWIVNVGIAQTPNIFYIGGRFTSTDNPLNNDIAHGQPYDGLGTFSVEHGASTTSGYHGFSGFTFFRDVEDENGNIVRYQYFASRRYTYLIYEGKSGVALDNSAAGVTFDAEGNMTGAIKGMTGDTNANFQYMLMVNLTDKDVEIPITYLTYKGSKITKDINGTAMIRQTSVAYDGARMGFAANSDGIVTFGHEATWIETAMTDLAVKDENGNFTLPETVTIPAGGFGWSPFTNQNNTALGIYCEVGAELVMEYYVPIR